MTRDVGKEERNGKKGQGSEQENQDEHQLKNE